jgi:hypothetical protein
MYELVKIFFIVFILTRPSLAQAQVSYVLADALPKVESRQFSWLQGDIAIDSERHSFLAGNDSAFKLLGRSPRGVCYALACFRDHLVIGSGLALQVLNVSRTDSPRVTSELYLGTVVQDVQVAGSYAFVATSVGFLVVDIADPMSIAEVARIQLAAIPARVELSTTLAFVLSAFGGLTVIDIANPRNPFVRNTIGTGGNSNVCLAVKDRIVYTGDLHSFNLEIYDATNPDSIRRYIVPIAAPALNAFVMDTLLFVTLWPANSLLRIFSIASPLAPRMLGQVQTGSRTYAMHREDNQLFAATPDSGVATIDISNLASPRVIARTFRQVPKGMGGLDLAANDSAIFLAHYAGVWITRPSGNMLSERGYFHTGTLPDRMRVEGTYLYVPYVDAGLQIFDISKVQTPVPIGFAEFNNGATDVALSGHFAFCSSRGFPADTNTGIWVIDVAHPSNPRIAAHLYLLGGGHRIAVCKNYAYIIRSDTGCAIVDVTNPLNPTLLSKYRTQGSVYGLAAKDNYIYLAVRDSGLIVVDASSPTNPRRVSKILDRALGVAVKDSIAYVAHDTGLVTLSIANPRGPYVLGVARTSGSRNIVDVSVGARYAYLAYDGLHAVDVSDPRNPSEVAAYGTSLSTVAVKADTLFATSTIGYVVLKHNHVVTAFDEEVGENTNGFVIAQNYPNPFNSYTTISFFTPKTDRVQIELFNLLGQKVAILWDGIAERGEHRLSVHSGTISSGTYFYRLSSSTGTVTRKMLFMR